MTATRVALTLVCLTSLVRAHAVAQEGSGKPSAPFVRAQLSPAGSATLGSPVQLQIDLVVPTWLTQPPELPDVDVENALVTANAQTSHSTETVGGESWSVFRYSYRIVPEAPGTIRVPAVTLTFRYAIDAVPSNPVTLQTSALTLEADVPAGAENLDYFFAAEALRLTEHYEPTPVHLEVGEAFTRTIELSADAVSGLTLPPIALAAPAGVKLTTEPPSLSDSQGERGAAARTTRLQRATYIAEREGQYRLPAVEVQYWNTAADAIRTVSLPAVAFDVAPAPAFTQEIAPTPEPVETRPAPQQGASPWMSWWRARWPWLLLVAGAALLAAVLLRRYGPGVRDAWVTARERWANSEARFFDAVRRAARTGDLRRTYSAAMVWLARLPPAWGAATFASLASRTGSSRLAEASDTLAAALYGSGAPGISTDPELTATFVSALADARRVVVGGGGWRVTRPGSGLPPLNPPSR